MRVFLVLVLLFFQCNGMGCIRSHLDKDVKKWKSLSECVDDTELFGNATINEIKSVLSCYSANHYEKRADEPQKTDLFENWKNDAQYFLSDEFTENMTPQKLSILHTWIDEIISGCFFCGCCHWPLEIMPEGAAFTKQWLNILKSKIELDKKVEDRISDLIFYFSLTNDQRKSMYD
jgi:hypothetical protein